MREEEIQEHLKLTISSAIAKSIQTGKLGLLLDYLTDRFVISVTPNKRSRLSPLQETGISLYERNLEYASQLAEARHSPYPQGPRYPTEHDLKELKEQIGCILNSELVS